MDPFKEEELIGHKKNCKQGNKKIEGKKDKNPA